MLGTDSGRQAHTLDRAGERVSEWAEALQAELRASVRARRIEALVAEAADVDSWCEGGEAEPHLARRGAAEQADSEATSRTLYIGGGGQVVTKGDVRAVMDAAAGRLGSVRPRLRSVSVSRGWAFAELESVAEVRPFINELWSRRQFPNRGHESMPFQQGGVLHVAHCCVSQLCRPQLPSGDGPPARASGPPSADGARSPTGCASR